MKALPITSVLEYIGAITPGNSMPVIPTPAGNKTLKSKTHYISGFLNTIGANGGEILLPANQQIVGVRSIDKNTLPSGIAFLITGIRVLFDTTVGLQAGAGVTGAAWASVAPVNFKNGDFSIAQNAELLSSSGSDLTNFKASTGNDDDFREISPILLRPDVAISIKMLLGGAAVADQAFKVELRGYELAYTDRS